MESATTWTPPQPCGIANVVKQPCVRQMLRKGRNLPTAPEQICWPWYPHGPKVSISLLVIAKPLLLSPQKFLNRRDFNLQWKIASSLSCLLLQLGSNDGEASLPDKGTTETTTETALPSLTAGGAEGWGCRRGLGSPWDWCAKAMASTIQWANLCLETAFPFCWPP